MSELKVFLGYRDELVRGLSALNTDALLRISKDLLRYGLITSVHMEILSSLDHDRLDSGTIARYLVQLVYDKIKVDITLCNKFLECMGSNKETGVAQLSRAITSQLASFTAGLEAKPCDAAERVLVESDLEELWEILIAISYRWEEISVLLKLPRATIEECRKASSNTLRLLGGLTEWVCGGHKQAKLPTLGHLKQVLASPVLGEYNILKKIEMMELPDVSSSEKPKPEQKISLVLQFQSVNTEVMENKSTLLEVKMRHCDSATYQWMKDEQPLSEGSSFSGTHSAILIIRNASSITQGKYVCHVSTDREELTSSPVTVTVIYPPDKHSLLEYYSTLKEVPCDSYSWPLVSPSTFVDLALIKTGIIKCTDTNFVKGEMADILEKRQKIDYSEAFCAYQRGALVLLEGRPGSGKTTLAHKITKDWAKGEILQNVSKLFLVSLRRDYNRLELFSTFFSSQSEFYINELEESNGKGACFVLEGYDEYSHKDKQDSIINKLIHKSYLPLAMVIVTSRPIATATLRPKATSIIEILGFTREQFEKFVDCYPFQDLDSSNELDSVKSFLKSSTGVINMCYLPLNANILCFLYGHLQGQEFPKTETQIYDHFVRAIILRQLRAANPLAKLPSLKDLPELEAQDFSQVCSIAFHMTVECKQVINDLSVPLKTSAVRSLLTIDKIVTQSGLEDVYTFLHLTLQEYLAACYLASLDKQQQAEMIKMHRNKDHMLNAFKFYCGLADFGLVQQFCDVISGDNVLYLLHCLYQTQDTSLFCAVLEEKLDGIIDVSNTVLTPVDFNILGDIISNASHLVKEVCIASCLLYEDYNSFRWLNMEQDTNDVMFYNFNSTDVCSNLKFWKRANCANISYTVNLRDVAEKYSAAFKTDVSDSIINYKVFCQQVLYSSDLFASDSAAPFINALKQCHKLEDIIIICKIENMRSTNSIADILKSCENIQEVIICGSYSVTGVSVLTGGLQHCKYLQKLMLINIDFSTDTSALAGAITHCKNMKTLNLIKCNIGSEGAEQIAHAISDMTLEELLIGTNSIKSKGIGYLSQCLAKNSNFEEFGFFDNNIDLSGIKTFAEVLNSFSKLHTLDLSYNDVGSEGAAALVQGLKACSILREINLSHCNLTGCGIVLISEALHTLENIAYLHLSNNGTTSVQEALAIADSLSSSKGLQKLYLSGNGIDSDSAITLSQGIQCCPFLHTLDLSNNAISSDGIAAITASFQCKELNLVDFSRNRIGEESADSIAMLVNPCHIKRLDLSHNELGSTGAKRLLTGLATSEFPSMINLLSNQIQPQDIEILKGLCKNTSLRVLLTV